MSKNGEGSWMCPFRHRGAVIGASETKVVVRRKGSPLGRLCMQILACGLITTPSSGDSMVVLEGILRCLECR